jgi:ParB family chromosome partitioning protein
VQERLAGEAVHRGLSVRALEETVRLAVREAQVADGAEDESTSGLATPTGEQPGSAPTRSLRPPGVHDLEELLEERLNTRVKVDMGGKRGRLVIEFATLDDLERIYRVIIGETYT